MAIDNAGVRSVGNVRTILGEKPVVWNCHFFFDSLAAVLQQDYGVRQVLLTTRFASTKPAEPEVIQQMAAEADFFVRLAAPSRRATRTTGRGGSR